MNHTKRLRTLAKIVYDPTSPFSFTQFCDFATALPSLQEDEIREQSDAEILDILINCYNVFTRLSNERTRFNSDTMNRATTKENSSEKAVSFIYEPILSPEDMSIEISETTSSFNRTRKLKKHDNLGNQKNLPRYFEAWYTWQFIEFLALTSYYFTYQNPFLGSISGIWTIVFIFAFYKFEQQAFAFTFIITSIVTSIATFFLTAFSLQTAYTTNAVSVNIGSTSFYLALELYFCISLARITYKKPPLTHPKLTILFLSFLIILLFSGSMILGILFSPLSSLNFQSTSSLTSDIHTSPSPSKNSTAIESNVELDMYGVPVVYWTSHDTTYHIQPDCIYRPEGGLFSSSADIAIERGASTSCPECVSHAMELKIHSSLNKKYNLTEEQCLEIEMNHLRDALKASTD